MRDAGRGGVRPGAAAHPLTTDQCDAPDPPIYFDAQGGQTCRCLVFRRRLTVTVLVGGDPDVVDDVLELDANTLTPNSTRREQFNKDLNKALVRNSKEAEAAEEKP